MNQLGGGKSNVEHRQHKGLNNQAEISHQPTRTREQRMPKFNSPAPAQRYPCFGQRLGFDLKWRALPCIPTMLLHSIASYIQQSKIVNIRASTPFSPHVLQYSFKV